MPRTKLNDRLKQLGAAIEAAQARAGNRSGFERDDIGDYLETLNTDLEKARHDNLADANARADAIEKRLEALRNRLSAGKPND